jgi:hypothetical protein
MLVRVMIYTAFTSSVSAKTKRHLAKLINEQVSWIEEDSKVEPTNKSLHDKYRSVLFNDQFPQMEEWLTKLKKFKSEHNGVHIGVWKMTELEYIRKLKNVGYEVMSKYGEIVKMEGN